MTTIPLLSSTFCVRSLYERNGNPRSSSASVRWRGGQLHRDAEPTGGAGREGEGSVVCLGDAFDDRHAETDTCSVGAYALGAALKWLGKPGNQLWGELLAGVLDSE